MPKLHPAAISFGGINGVLSNNVTALSFSTTRRGRSVLSWIGGLEFLEQRQMLDGTIDAHLDVGTSNASNPTSNPLGSATVLSLSANQIVAGETELFTATVIGSTVAPAGLVNFIDGTSTIGTGTLSPNLTGYAGFAFASFSTAAFAVGTHTITASYSGGNFPASTSGPISLIVISVAVAATTTTALSVKVNPITFGQLETFVATVSSAGDSPMGIVSFIDGSNTIGTGVLEFAGAHQETTTFSTASLAPGTHSISAMYFTGTHDPSSSTPVNLVVRKQDLVPTAATIGLALASKQAQPAGTQVVFESTISPTTPSTTATAPTGTVAFLDGTTTLATASLDSNPAITTSLAVGTFGVSDLSIGVHLITASYSGDADYAPIASIAGQFLIGTDHQRFVAQIYRDLLGREVDAGGLAAWTNALDSGTTYAQVATLITSSREYDGIVVDAFYFDLLGRHAETGGLDAWVDQMQKGLNAQVIRAGILGSDEYFNRTGPGDLNGTPATFVTALYRTFLGRAPDAGGLNAWLGVLNNDPANRQTVAAGISNSDENQTVIITGFYQSFLHRNPDAAGLKAWKSELADGISQPQIVTFFVTTPEYIGRLGITG